MPDTKNFRHANHCTTKERAPYSAWLVDFALGQHFHVPKALHFEDWSEYKRRMKTLAAVRQYRRDMKREPIARQTEIVFPLQLK